MEKKGPLDKSSADRENVFILEDIYPQSTGLFAPYAVASSASESVIVAIDTSALLLPYNLSSDNLSALAEVYRRLSKENRLFIPARVAREFIRQRDRNLAEIIKALNDRKSRVFSPEAQLSPLLTSLDEHESIAVTAEAVKTQTRLYISGLAKLIEKIRGWRGDDPVSRLYNEIFTDNVIIEHGGDRTAILSDWKDRLKTKIPPGYKDASKDDEGIGDYLIWRTLLKLGEVYKKDMVFVTGEEKADWFVRTNKEAVYPRPELVQEYRLASGGCSIRLSSLHEILSELNVAPELVREVATAEELTEASGVGIVKDVAEKAKLSKGGGSPISAPEIVFDYSTNDGCIEIGAYGSQFSLRFSKASNTSIHFHRTGSLKSIARVKSVSEGHVIQTNAFDRSSQNYTIQLGEAFFAENLQGDVLTGRIVGLKDDTREETTPMRSGLGIWHSMELEPKVQTSFSHDELTCV